MYKTTITETTKKYDKEGHLTEETVRTETTEDYELDYSPHLKFDTTLCYKC